MKYYEVTDPLFAQYGRIITGIDTEPICDVLRTLPLSDDMTYVASEPQLEALEAYHFFQNHVFAGMPIQMGYVTGKNARLDCLEHHMCSEIIMDTEDVMDKSGTMSLPAGGAYTFEFVNVSFKYPQSDQYTLENISCIIPSGRSLPA